MSDQTERIPINKNVTPNITSLDEDNLKELVKAVQQGTLAMVSTRRKGSLDHTVLLCSVKHDLKTATSHLTPLAELLRDGDIDAFHSPYEDISQSAIN